MRLAISNLAWDVAEDQAIAELLRAYQLDAIDIAPTKYFPAPHQASERDIRAVRTFWAERGIEITGMQALLFGTTGLSIFGAPEVQLNTLRHLETICRIGRGLGARRLVFGSPKNRDRTGISDEESTDQAVHFFRRLGELATTHEVTICLEPNPERYGCNFMRNSATTAEIVRRTDHPAIKMQLDLGALAINGEAPAQVLKEHAALIGHIHLSEPDLVPLGDGSAQHEQAAAALLRYLPAHVATIEMLAPKSEPHPAAIERALQTATRYYRPATTPGFTS